jgi:ribosome production factor 1
VEEEEKQDEFAKFFEGKVTPKILLTSNEHPSPQIFEFLKEVKTLIPNCLYYPRRNYTL